MTDGNGLYIVVFSIFAVLILILLIVSIIAVLKVIETLKKVDNVIDDVNGKAKKLDGLFDIVYQTSNVVSSVNSKIVDCIVGIIQNFLDKRKKKEE